MLVAGADCSTQSTKVVIVDLDSGRVVAEGRAGHEVHGAGGARETHPDVWWEALAAALGSTGIARDVAAISVAGQQHGMVTLDRMGRPVRPAPLWNDTRSAPDAAYLLESLGGAAWWANRIGVVPVASFTVTKWRWLRRTEPDAANATAGVRLPHDFLTQRLTGSGVTDRGDASGTGWWSTADEDYVDDVLGHPDVDLDRAMLPRVATATEAAGSVTPSAADALGLRPGIPVGPGTGDNAGAALGLGLEPGTPVISLGTSGTAYVVSSTRTVDPSGTIAGFADATGRFLPLAATLNCTLAVDRVAAWLGLDRDAVADETSVVVLPYLDGERTPNLPNAAGTITGLRHATTAEEILLGAYRGAAASLLDAVEAIGRLGSGIVADAPIVLIGGGARGITWQRVIAELSGRALSIPDASELVALGAAAQAASVLTGEAPDAVSRRWRTRAGDLRDPATRNDAAWDRINAVREATAKLNQ